MSEQFVVQTKNDGRWIDGDNSQYATPCNPLYFGILIDDIEVLQDVCGGDYRIVKRTSEGDETYYTKNHFNRDN